MFNAVKIFKLTDTPHYHNVTVHFKYCQSKNCYFEILEKYLFIEQIYDNYRIWSIGSV